MAARRGCAAVISPSGGGEGSGWRAPPGARDAQLGRQRGRISRGALSQVLSGRGAAEVGERRGERSARARAARGWARGQWTSLGSPWSPAGRDERGKGADAGAERPGRRGWARRGPRAPCTGPPAAPGVSRHPPGRPRPPASCADLSRGCGEEAGLPGNGVLLFVCSPATEKH